MIRRRLLYSKARLNAVDWRFYLSLLTGLLFASVLYGFLLGARELCRIGLMSGYYSWYSPVSSMRLYFFNVFIAFICSAAGFAIFGNMWMSANIQINPRIRVTALLDQQFLTGSFIHLSTKLGWFFGFMLLGTTITYNIDFFSELWPYFFISPIFIFLQQWLTLRRRMRHVSVRVMVYSAIIQTTFSFIIAAVPIYDSAGLSRLAAEHTPELSMDVTLPTSRVSEMTFRKSLAEDVHVGYLKGTQEVAVSFGMFNSTFIPVDTLENRTIHARYNTREDYVLVDLYADKNIPARKIIDMIHVMRKGSETGVRFMTNWIKEGKGIPTHFYRYCEEVSNDMNVTYYYKDWDTVFVTPTTPCNLHFRLVKNMELNVLRLIDNRIILNDTLITKQNLYDWCRKEIENDFQGISSRACVYVTADEKSSYEILVGVFEETYAALLDIRREEVKKRFNVDYTTEEPVRPEVEKYAKKFSGVHLLIVNDFEKEYLISNGVKLPDK